MALCLCLPASTQAQNLEELRAVKITNVDSQVLFSDEAIANAMDYLASIGINAVLPVVQNAGYTQYPSEVMNRHFGKPIDPRFAGRDPLGTLIREAHRVGIEVYPWFEYGFASHFSGLNGPATGGHILQKYPHWAARHLNGDICKKNGFDWMNGIHEEVQDFIIELVMEIIANYDVDGIEFSDRMPAMPVECGYDDYTKALHQQFNGIQPPDDYNNQTWKQWRANELTYFYSRVRDSVKTADPKLFVASSPNVFPWGMDQYLQDSQAWVNRGYVDHWLPQFYRYNISDYQFELDRAWNQILPANRDKLFAGVLMNVGSYTISKEFLDQSLAANRAKGVKGEGYFFYEGLRRNNDELGDHLRENWYQEPATVPGRNGELHRFPALPFKTELRNISGWRETDIETPQGSLFVWDQFTEGDPSQTSLIFNINEERRGWYDVHVWTVADEAYAQTVHVIPSTIPYKNNQNPVEINDGTRTGWYHIGTYFLGPVLLKDDSGGSVNTSYDGDVLFLDRTRTAQITDKPIAIGGAMATINRKIKEDPSSIERNPNGHPHEITLASNYPNPFNPSTIIRFSLPEATAVKLSVYDQLGRHVVTLQDGLMTAGEHNFRFNATGLASGIYIYRLEASTYTATGKMLFLK